MKKINTFFVGLSVVLVVVVSMFASPAQAAEEVDGRARNGNDALRGINGDGRGSRNEHVALRGGIETSEEEETWTETTTVTEIDAENWAGWKVHFDNGHSCTVAQNLSGQAPPEVGTAVTLTLRKTFRFWSEPTHYVWDGGRNECL
jgi:hypothetical protein